MVGISCTLATYDKFRHAVTPIFDNEIKTAINDGLSPHMINRKAPNAVSE